MNGSTIVPHNKCGLVWMQAHAVDGSIDLKHSLTLLLAPSYNTRLGGGGGGGDEIVHKMPHS